MKAIIISIRPEWIEKILNGEKTIEIRKTKPNCDLPIKCYIYCTKPRRWFVDSPFTMFSYEELWIQDGKIYNGKDDSLWNPDFNHYYRLNGRVVAEFTLNKIEDFSKWEYDFGALIRHLDLFAGTEGNYPILINYLNKQCKGFAWHIDNLKIYDKPKELSEFSTTLHRMKGKEFRYTSHLLQRPPQSWCYVEELDGVCSQYL